MKFKEIIVKTIDLGVGSYTDSNGIINPIQPLEIYLVPIPFTTEHERYVTDNNGVVSKQSSGATGEPDGGIWDFGTTGGGGNNGGSQG